MFGLPWKTWLQVGLATFVGLVVLVTIGVCIAGIGEDGAGDRLEARATVRPAPRVSAIPTVTITPTPSRVWTAQELVDCDTTTLRRQLDDRARPGELLSGCEVALFNAQLRFGVLISEESNLSRAERAELLEHVANLEEIQQELDDMGSPRQYSDVLISCRLLPNWTETVQGAVDYIAANPREELLGWEVEVLRYQRFIKETTAICDRT